MRTGQVPMTARGAATYAASVLTGVISRPKAITLVAEKPAPEFVCDRGTGQKIGNWAIGPAQHCSCLGTIKPFSRRLSGGVPDCLTPSGGASGEVIKIPCIPKFPTARTGSTK